MRAQDLFAALVGLTHNGLHLRIDLARSGLGIGLRFLIIPTNKDLMTRRIGDRADRVRHAVGRDHIPRELCCTLKIV